MDCEICHGTRWKSVDVDGAERLVRCDCWRADLTERLMKQAHIKPRYARCELSTFKHNDMDTLQEAHRRATRFVEAFPVVDKGLLYYGMPGVGKTHLAVGILKEVIRKKSAVGYFFETGELLKLVRDTYNRSVEATEMEVLDPVLNCDLLVLDDLGSGKTSEWVQETLGLVINHRYNSKKPTIITTNLTDPADSTSDFYTFVVQLGVRTRSRLKEMCDWVEVEGFDVRETGPEPSDQGVLNWQKNSPASPENLKRAKKGLPPQAKAMARARLKDTGTQYELNWSGGKAGSK